MKILTVDIGTGTQDILLYDSRLHLENGFKLVAPAPTMIRHQQIKQATHRGQSILLTGRTMGGGPSHWAVEQHIQAGYPVFATPAAARSFNDDLDLIQEQGIQLVGDDEAKALLRNLPGDLQQIEMCDFDFPAIARAFAQFGVSLDDLTALAIAVFDHGAAPPGYSDRQFRFDFITDRLQAYNRLSTFAFLGDAVPPTLTRLQAVADSAQGVDALLVVMDTAPAAVLGATLDDAVRTRGQLLIANIGNFHTIAFRLRDAAIEGVFEHHTGMVDRPKLDRLLRALADGTLTHQELFDDHGHGAFILQPSSFLEQSPRPSLTKRSSSNASLPPLVVTGPRRTMMRDSTLRPYFATPYGDMMLTGCFGLLAAIADLLPELGNQIRPSLYGKDAGPRPPWELD